MEPSSDRKGLLTEMIVTGMPEGKDYQGMDMVLPFVGRLTDIITGCLKDARVTSVQTKVLKACS